MSVVFGTTGADLIAAAAASDSVFGLAGNDTLASSFATADLHGGQNDDLLVVDFDYQIASDGAHPDTQWLLYGDDGNDTITASAAITGLNPGSSYVAGILPPIDTVIDGGNGNDSININIDVDTVFYDAFISGYSSPITVNNVLTDLSGDNSVRIVTSLSAADEFSVINTTVDLGAGNDSVTVHSSSYHDNYTGDANTTVNLGDGNNQLSIQHSLGWQSVLVSAGAGADTITLDSDFQHGNDIPAHLAMDIDVGAGNDTVSFSAKSFSSGYDSVSGTIDLGQGDDVFLMPGVLSPYTAGGNYTVYGGLGSDTFDVKMDGISADGLDSNVTFDLGDGTNTFDGSLFNTSASIVAGSGTDTVRATLVASGWSVRPQSYMINLGAGNNLLTVDLDGQPLSVVSGAGNDAVIIAWTGTNIHYPSIPAAGVVLDLSDGNNLIDLDIGAGNASAIPFAQITTGTGADYIDISGGTGNVISTGAGNDTIVGLGGVDAMTGGDGDDTYTVDDLSDQVIETNAVLATGGADTVQSWLSFYTLGANVEKGRIMLSGNANLTGNGLNNALFAGNGNNVMDGGAGTGDSAAYRHASGAVSVSLAIVGAQATGGSGTDTLLNIEHLSGSLFNDTLTGSSGANWIGGEDGNDVISAGSGNDTLLGGIGNDSLTGGTGNDLMTAGDGDDTLIYGSGLNGFDAVDGGLGANDRILANASNVTIGLSSLTGIEQISAAGFTGAKIVGTTANNTLDFSSVSLTGISSIDAGSGADTVTGSAGDDIIIAGAGNDVLRGSGGNDVFRVGASAGTDTFDGGGGTDRIEAAANGVTLTMTGSNITGVEGISGAGFTGFTLAGTSAANSLNFSGIALSGVARINGGSGNDTISGSAGNDVIEGNIGKDMLTGGFGADTFDFNLATHSRGTAIDRITDFARGQDIIDLSSIDADGSLGTRDSFLFIGADAFTGLAGQLRYDTTLIAGTTRVLADLNGDKVIDMEIHLTGTYVLAGSDLLL